MNRIGNMLRDAIGRDEVIRTARAQATLRQWNLVVGESMAQRSCPERFERGTVWVAVEGAAWAQELRMRKMELLGRLAEISRDRELFVDIRFGVRRSQGLQELALEEAPVKIERVVDPSMSIREIAERRLRSWPGDEPS